MFLWSARINWDLIRADAERIFSNSADGQWILQDMFSGRMPVSPYYWAKYLGTEMLGDAGPLFVMKQAQHYWDRYWDHARTPGKVPQMTRKELRCLWEQIGSLGKLRRNASICTMRRKIIASEPLAKRARR